jgi:Holliday junction resolvase RusA-like endonuclease
MLNPESLKSYEAMIRWEATIAAHKCGATMFEKPVCIEATFTFAMPASWSKKKREGLIYRSHNSAPDLSNLVKAIEDGMNGVIFADDRLVSVLQCRKVWGEKDSIEVKVYPADL